MSESGPRTVTDFGPCLYVGFLVPKPYSTRVDKWRNFINPRRPDSPPLQPAHVTAFAELTRRLKEPKRALEAVQEIVPRYQVCSLRTTNLAVLPDERAKDKRMIHLRIAEHQVLMDLNQELIRKTGSTQTMTFTPHITVARFVSDWEVKQVVRYLEQQDLAFCFAPDGPFLVPSNGKIRWGPQMIKLVA